MEKSQAVMTVMGAPGWEAILHDTPSLVFGPSWYKECPGVFRVNDVASCKAAIETIRGGFRIDQRDVISYLKSLDEASIHGFIAASNAANSKLNRTENMESIKKCILNELEHLSR